MHNYRTDLAMEAFDGEKLVASGISTAFRLQEVHS